MQKDQFLAMFGSVEMHVQHAFGLLWQAGQFEIVRGEQCKGAGALRQMQGASMGQGEAIVGAGTATHLVH